MSEGDSIRYVNTLDDLTLGSDHYQRKSPGMQVAFKWGGALIAFILSSWSDEHRLLVRFLAGLVGVAVWLIIVWITSAPWMTRGILWLYGRTIKGVLGDHRLTVTQTGLLEETAYNRTEIPWSGVGSIEMADGRTLIRLKRISVHIIPHDRILEGDLNAFLEAVRGRTGAAIAGSGGR